jgi:hypothetical protein
MIKISDIIQAERYLLKKLKRKRVSYTLLNPIYTVHYNFVSKGIHIITIWYNTQDNSTHAINLKFKLARG